MDSSQKIQQWENGVREIDLLQVLIHLLQHIIPILICALLGAAILGGVKLVSDLRGSENPENLENEEATLEYENALALYEFQMESYNDQLQTAYESLTQYEEYRNSSILLNMDPKNYYQKEFVWFVNAGEERAEAVRDAYAAVFGWDYYYYVQEHISERYEALYLSELISISYGEDASGSSNDADTSRLSLTISSPTEKLLQEISDATNSYLEENWPRVTEAMDGYEITLLIERKYVRTESYDSGTVIQAQNDYNQKIETLLSAILNLETKISGLTEPKSPFPEELEQAAPRFSKNAIKYALIGLFLGAFLSAGWLTVRFVMSDVVLNEDEIQRCFGVYILASVRRFNGSGLWRRLLSRLSGDANRAATPEAAAALAYVNLESMMEATGRRGEKVLLVGGDETALEETERLVEERISDTETPNRISAGGNILVDQGAVERLQNYDNVVLVVRKGSTRSQEIGRELEKLLALKKNIIGLIVL